MSDGKWVFGKRIGENYNFGRCGIIRMSVRHSLLEVGALEATLSASAEPAFSHFFAPKKLFFTIAHFRERNMVFYDCMKTGIFTMLHSS